MSRKIPMILILALLAALLVPSLAFAVNVTLTLSSNTANPRDSVTASGIADPDTDVSIKVLDVDTSIIVIDFVRSDANGSYSCTFKVPDTSEGTLTVVAGYGRNVANKTLTVGTAPMEEDTIAPSWSSGSLEATNVSQTGLVLSWSGATDNVGVTGYKVYQDDTLLTTTPVTGSSYNVSDLSAGTQYTFKVEAGDAAGNWSSTGPRVTAETKAGSGTGTGPGSGGGGSTSSPQAVDTTTGSASVAPGLGGKISLGSDVSIEIPSDALNGTANVTVTIKKVNSPPAIPAGFSLQGNVFEFTVGGNASYSFNKPVTLTFTYDPDSLADGEIPAIYYYDEVSAQWVNLGGDISGDTITVTVDHFTKFAVLTEEVTPPAEQQPLEQPPLFSDVPASYWASDVINKLSGQGYINGYPDGSFRPDNSISRAEFATVLVKAFKLPVASGKVFDDTANHWAKEHIAAAYAAGIVSGYSENSFGPDDLITREQMAVMIVKAAKIEAATEEITFTDGDAASAWSKDALAAAAQAKIMQGYPDGTFAPQNKATRAEAVTVIANALE